MPDDTKNEQQSPTPKDPETTESAAPGKKQTSRIVDITGKATSRGWGILSGTRDINPDTVRRAEKK